MKKIIVLSLITFLVLIFSANVFSQNNTELSLKDQKEVTSKALDYIEGWFEGNPDRMKSCLHPDLAKRSIYINPKTGRSVVSFHSASTLVESTRMGNGKKYPKDKRDIQISILHMNRGIASVKITSLIMTEYLHLVKYNGEWAIINVLFEMNPREDIEKILESTSK
jgi:hypothetical protein